jgi:hypothetical protein
LTNGSQQTGIGGDSVCKFAVTAKSNMIFVMWQIPSRRGEYYTNDHDVGGGCLVVKLCDYDVLYFLLYYLLRKGAAG